jgi:uncharacterized membrane protein YuzA (DUF378 family)
MKKYSAIDLIAVILLLVGGLNWGLVGLFDFDLIMAIFGMVIARIIFVLVGLSAVYRIVVWARMKSAK